MQQNAVKHNRSIIWDVVEMTRGEDFQDFKKMSEMVEFIWFMFVHCQILIGDTLNSLLKVSTAPKVPIYYFYSVVVKTSSFEFKVKPRPEVESEPRQRPEEGRVWVSTRSEEGLNDSVLNMLSFGVWILVSHQYQVNICNTHTVFSGPETR